MDELLKRLNRYSKKCIAERTDNDFADAVEQAKDELQKPKWIPVSERLPDPDEGLVLVCMPNEFPYNEKQPFTNVEHDCRVRIAIYVIDEWYLDGYKLSRQNPIAWMKLPKPYELQKEETDG